MDMKSDKLEDIEIKQLLGYYDLERFKIFAEATLFPPQWEALKESRCPLCNNKLKFPKKAKIAFCNGVKHKKPFVISTDKLSSLS